MAFVDRDGTEVWWEQHGSGDEAVLLTMGHRYDGRMWHRVVAALSQRYTCITFDNRGVGRTKWDGLPFGIPDLAKDGLAALTAAGFEKAHVYGASMGGLTAQEVALSAPERTQKLVLACTGVLADDATPPPPPPLPKRLLLKAATTVLPTSVQRRIANSMGVGPRADKQLVKQDERIITSTHTYPGGLEAQGVAIAGYRSKTTVPGITAKTLVLHGTADKIVPYSLGVELASLIPGATLVTLDEAGHNYLVDRGSRANDVVLDFLTS